MTQPTKPDTIAQLLSILNQLKAGDRLLILKFASAILADRQGKRSQRRQQHARRGPPTDDHWQIGR